MWLFLFGLQVFCGLGFEFEALVEGYALDLDLLGGSTGQFLQLFLKPNRLSHFGLFGGLSFIGIIDGHFGLFLSIFK
jgi:hypothetical protein